MLTSVAVLAWVLLAASPNPRSAELLSRAYAAMADKDCEGAVSFWRELAALEPQDARARVELGRCLLRLDKPHEAQRALEEAVALDAAVKDGEALLAKARRIASVTPEISTLEAAASRQARGGPHIGGDELSLGEIARRAPKRSGTGRTYELQEGSGTAAVSAELAAEEAAAPRTLLDSMRQRAESVLRPRMESAAPAIGELQRAWDQYQEACHNKTTTTFTRSDGSSGTVVRSSSGQEPNSYGSQAQWDQYWTSATTQRNEDTPACLALAGRINSLANSLVGMMEGADRELALPPSVYPGIREEVFDRLADELW